MDMEMKIYTISFNNYHGETYEEHYFQMKHALTRFLELSDEGKRQDGYDDNGLYSFSFFDAAYNADSTYISLSDGKIKDLFQDWRD